MKKNSKLDTDLFAENSKGLSEAIEWAKNQPSTKVPGISLYDEIYQPRADGFTNLFLINEEKKKIINNMK